MRQEVSNGMNYSLLNTQRLTDLHAEGHWELAESICCRILDIVHGMDLESRTAIAQDAYMLALALFQIGRSIAARRILRRIGCKYHLSECLLLADAIQHVQGSVVLHGQQNFHAIATSGENAAPIVIDNAIDSWGVMKALLQGFAPEGRYWCHHGYGLANTPFFSYTHRLGSPPQNALESAIDLVHHQLSQSPWGPRMGGVKWVEIWAHSRGPADPHQLHVDLDERRLRKGKGQYMLCNPVISSILYLDSNGGPTVVLDQTATSGLAARAWKIYPRECRLLSFRGSLVHGVLPGAVPDTLTSGGGCPQRTTLVMAWWGKLEREPFSDTFPSPLMLLPRPRNPNAPAWLRDFSMDQRLEYSAQLETKSNTPLHVELSHTVCKELVFSQSDWQRHSGHGTNDGCYAKQLMGEGVKFREETQRVPRMHIPQSVEPAWTELQTDGNMSEIETCAGWSVVQLPPLRFFLRDGREFCGIYSSTGG
eukprot:jgi/Botrbrau1/5762/Bobra.0134s0031.2